MRIVILADPLDNQYAGIHIYTKEMIRSVTALDKQNEYILIREKKSDEFPDLRQIAVPNLPRWTGYQALRFFVIFPMIIRKLKPDLVIEPAHFGPFNLPQSIRRMTIIHDLTPLKLAELHRGYSSLLQRIFLKGILRKADLILTNSNNTLKDVNEVFPFTREKLKMIYPGKDALFEVADPEKVKRKYNLINPYFIFVGTIEPRKNLMLLLASYALFRKKSSKHTALVFAGKYGWKSNPFREALKKNPYRNDIRMLGYVDRNELPALYSGAMAMVYPSLYEGFGFPVVEAMACGTPCILSDNSSLPEVGGEAALYFDCNNSSELAEQMMKLASDEDLQKTLSEKSLNQAGKFNWKQFAFDFKEIIRKELP